MPMNTLVTTLLTLLNRPLYPDAALLIFRLMIGGALAYFGYGKLTDDMAGFVSFVTGKLGLPAFLAYAAAYSELVGGLLIVLGGFTRLASTFALVTMLVAAFVAHGADPFSKKEHALVYAASALLLLAIGAGKYSLDALLQQRQNAS
jgi:putative oxidoreductase